MGSIMITHSLADLDELATEEDPRQGPHDHGPRRDHRLGRLPPRELARVAEIAPLTAPNGHRWRPGRPRAEKTR